MDEPQFPIEGWAIVAVLSLTVIGIACLLVISLIEAHPILVAVMMGLIVSRKLRSASSDAATAAQALQATDVTLERVPQLKPSAGYASSRTVTERDEDQSCIDCSRPAKKKCTGGCANWVCDNHVLSDGHCRNRCDTNMLD